jgi:hypothetical protein
MTHKDATLIPNLTFSGPVSMSSQFNLVASWSGPAGPQGYRFPDSPILQRVCQNARGMGLRDSILTYVTTRDYKGMPLA